MPKAKCARTDFTKATDDQLDSKAVAVKDGIASNPTDFPSPPFSVADFTTRITNYVATRNAYVRGGLDQKPAFLAAKEILLDTLEETADYVDDIADGDIELIVKGGFVPTKTAASPKPAPDKPTGVILKRGQATGEVFLECDAQSVGEYYGAIASEGVPLSEFSSANGILIFEGNRTNNIGIDVNKSRKKHFTNLIPGTTYYFYMYIGNATGISALSDVVSIMAA